MQRPGECHPLGTTRCARDMGRGQQSSFTRAPLPQREWARTLTSAVLGDRHREGTGSLRRNVHTRANVVSKNERRFELRVGAVVASSSRDRPLSRTQPALDGGFQCPLGIALSPPQLLLQQVRLMWAQAWTVGNSGKKMLFPSKGWVIALWATERKIPRPLSCTPISVDKQGRERYQQLQGRIVSQQRHLCINFLTNLLGMRQGT